MRQIKVNKEVFTPRRTRAGALYLNEVDRTKMISPEKEAEIAFLARSGDENAKELLINSNLRFVLTVAKNYARDPEDFAEIVAAGNVGLVDAASVFDPSRGFKFISFAVWHIRKEILKHLSDNGRLVRLPGNQVNAMKAMGEAANEISMVEGREATVEETIERIKIKNPDRFARIRTDRVYSALKANYKAASLDKPVGNDGDSTATLLDLINVGYDEPDFEISSSEPGKIVNKLINVLTSKEMEIVFRRHGIEPFAGHEESFSEISENMGVEQCSENVRTKYLTAMKKLKKHAEQMNYKLSDII